MNKPQGGLGRGLGALIPQKIAPEPQSEAGQEVSATLRHEYVPTGAIVPNPHQPRKNFSEEELANLTDSVKEHGVLQPLVVTDLGEGKYELIAGERRLRASKAAGLDRVPVIIRGASKQEKVELALIENIQRHDLNPVEEALAYQSLSDLFDMTHDEVAKRVGKSRSQVTNTIRLLDLDQDILDALVDKKITKSHARTLLSEADRVKRRALFAEMLSGGMTVRQAEAKTSEPVKSTSGSSSGDRDPNMIALEDKLREVLETKVKISMKEGRGSVTIHFYSKGDLKNLIEKLTE